MACSSCPQSAQPATSSHNRGVSRQAGHSYTTEATSSRQHSRRLVNQPQSYKMVNNAYFSNEHVFLKDFVLSFAINNQFDPCTGMTTTNGIPSALLDWCPKDQPEKVHPKYPDIRWEVFDGYLIVRDVSLKGDPDLCYEEGGQIVVKRYFGIPLCALPAGYPANKLQGLGDALGQFFDNETIKRDPQKNNKFVATVAEAMIPKRPKFYLDQDKSKELFIYDEDGDFYYFNAGSLDKQVAVNVDGLTIAGDGKQIKLKTL